MPKMVAILATLTFSLAINAQIVRVKKNVNKGRTIIEYTIENNTKYPIIGFDVGSNDGMSSFLLKELPLGWKLSKPSNGITCPPRWSGKVELQEESDYHQVSFSANDDSHYILQGKSLGVFVVTLPKNDFAYCDSKCIVYFKGISKKIISLSKQD